MGDSEDEYSSNSKRNRDKFHREREDSGNYGRNERRDWSNDRKEPWKNPKSTNLNPPYQPGAPSGNNSNMPPSYNNNLRGSGLGGLANEYQRRYNPANFDVSPPHKKNKKEWEGGHDYNRNQPSNSHGNQFDSSYNYSIHQNYAQNQVSSHQHGGSGDQTSAGGIHKSEPEYPTQPACLSFKQFLQQQDDSISDEDAIKKYNEYKIEFRKTQINEFFLAHKEEEWFKTRYHPDENFKRHYEQKYAVIKRLEIFMDLLEKGWLKDVAVEIDRSEELIKFLDAAVIKMEGGSDFDLKTLEPQENVENNGEQSSSITKSNSSIEIVRGVINEDKEATNGHIEKQIKADTDEPQEGEVIKEEKVDHENEINVKTENSEEITKKKVNKRKNKESNDSGSESGAYSESENEENASSNGKKKNGVETSNEQAQATSGDNKTRPKDLHRTTSIFIRNLPPSVTKEELENVFKNQQGYKRVALADPAPERGFYRRSWITFDSSVDIRKICWSTNNGKLRDWNPGAIVNKDLNRRVRPSTTYICNHKAIIRNDIKVATKIIENLDKRWNLWDNDMKLNDFESKSNVNDESLAKEGLKDDIEGNDGVQIEPKSPTNKTQSSPTAAALAATPITTIKQLDPKYEELKTYKFTHTSNPLLENITDYLVDEMNAEEEELLGGVGGDEDSETPKDKANNKEIEIDIDETYKRVLDKLVLYLRVVHSFDYYNFTEYQQEDSMPNRCGIIHARTSLPIDKETKKILIKQEDVDAYILQFEIKMKPYIDYKDKLDEDAAKKLGIKDKIQEIEKFVKTNTQELAADRWLCPLSGKKFKGPEFIRKHLFYKHADKINEVKKEVEYFNNYLMDPKRPQLPEHQSLNKTTQPSTQQQQTPNQNPYSGSNIQTSSLIQQYTIPPPNHGGNYNRPYNMWPQHQQMPMQQMNMQASGYARPGFNPMNMHGYMNNNRNFNGNYNQNRFSLKQPGVRDQREIIHYKDLDAPEDL